MALRGCLRTHQTCCFCLFFKRRLFLRADLHESTYELHLLYTCVYLPAVSSLHTRVMCASGAAAFDPAAPGQVGLQPVTTVIVSRALILPACLSYYRASRGSLVVFDTWKFVCPSARQRSPRSPVCSAVN